jgi:hypothetical protein
MSYHGKLQTLKNGTADAEIQLWAYQQLEKEPAKTLTDEEIVELANKYLYVLNDVPYANDIKDFAKAILRKAQDK